MDITNEEKLQNVQETDGEHILVAYFSWADNTVVEDEEVAEVKNGKRKLKMTIDGQEIFITLYDTPAANELYGMLPLELNFEDFNGVEKISYLSQKLSTKGEPDGCDPDVGDLCLYAPWGNLSVFYQDFRYSDGLVMLGHIDSGMEFISSQSDDFSAILEAANVCEDITIKTE